MRLEWVLFAFLLAMCGVVVAAFVIEEIPFEDAPPADGGETVRSYLGHGVTHPEYSTLAVGEYSERHDNILWVGLVFGLLQVGFFVTLLAYGGSKHGTAGPLRIPILVGAVIYGAIFTALVFSYRSYANRTEHDLVLNLPAPSAWMVYGVWLFPLVFLVLYIRRFDDWIFTEADEERFRTIIAERDAAEPEA